MSETSAAPAIVEEVLTRPPDDVDVRVPDEAAGDGGTEEPAEKPRELVFELSDIEIQYSGVTAVRNVDLEIAANEITAFIGPSGCGKTTVLRSLNRMHDLTPGAKVIGRITYHGEDLYGSKVDPAEVRRRIGMVFQKPNPFPKSIHDNVAYGPRINGRKRGDMDDIVESRAARAPRSGTRSRTSSRRARSRCQVVSNNGSASPARLAVEPDVILMDEPCSALDPIATARIEDLMEELKRDYTIVIVTHNMQQAARVSDRTAFFTAEVDDGGRRHGLLVEYDVTETMFTNPSDARTEGYITGRFG